MRSRLLVAFGFVVAAAALALAVPERGAAPTGAAGAKLVMPDGIRARGKIKRVVVIVMENRTFDNVFGGDTGSLGHPTPFPSADALVPSPIASVMRVSDFASAVPPPPNNWYNAYQCVAAGGFTDAAWQADAQSPMPCSGWHFDSPNGPFRYLDASNRAVYSAIARQYELGDAFFAPAATDSYPGHQFIVAGRSSDADGDQIADQPLYTPAPRKSYGGYATGCADVLSSGRNVPTPPIVVPALGPTASPWAVPITRGFEGECYDAVTFADRLAEAHAKHGTSWKHYATSTTIPAPFSGEQAFNGFINAKRWWNHRWTPTVSVLADAQFGEIPNFAWVKPPCVDASDHPGTGNGGPSWVKDVVNAIGSNRNQWNETAIFVLWDDWGGFYDHVVPPPRRAWDNLGPGLRTPLLVISPYVRPGTVAHARADYGSVLRFVEQLEGVGSLGAIDAHSPDLVGYFDFATMRPFTRISTAPVTTWRAACRRKGAHPAAPFRD